MLGRSEHSPVWFWRAQIVKKHDVDSAVRILFKNAGEQFQEHVVKWGAVHADKRRCVRFPCNAAAAGSPLYIIVFHRPSFMHACRQHGVNWQHCRHVLCTHGALMRPHATNPLAEIRLQET